MSLGAGDELSGSVPLWSFATSDGPVVVLDEVLVGWVALELG